MSRQNNTSYDPEDHGARGSAAYVLSAVVAALTGALKGLSEFDPTLIPPGFIEPFSGLMLIVVSGGLLFLNWRRIQREKAALLRPSPVQEVEIRKLKHEVEVKDRVLKQVAETRPPIHESR